MNIHTQLSSLNNSKHAAIFLSASCLNDSQWQEKISQEINRKLAVSLTGFLFRVKIFSGFFIKRKVAC
jgi:hypothetical protein